MFKHYYHILGLREGATKSEIKRAYYKKAKLLHPDVNDSPEAHEKFIKIQLAYEILYEGKVPKKARYKPNPRNSRPKSYADAKRDMRREKKARDPYFKEKQKAKYQEEGPATRFQRKYIPEEYSALGRLICYGFLFAIGGFGCFLAGLPLFVLIFFPERAFNIAALVSLLFGWFLLKYASDWYNDLKYDFAEQPSE